jgi:hypothetical protein
MKLWLVAYYAMSLPYLLPLRGAPGSDQSSDSSQIHVYCLFILAHISILSSKSTHFFWLIHGIIKKSEK